MSDLATAPAPVSGDMDQCYATWVARQREALAQLEADGLAPALDPRGLDRELARNWDAYMRVIEGRLVQAGVAWLRLQRSADARRHGFLMLELGMHREQVRGHLTPGVWSALRTREHAVRARIAEQSATQAGVHIEPSEVPCLETLVREDGLC